MKFWGRRRRRNEKQRRGRESYRRKWQPCRIEPKRLLENIRELATKLQKPGWERLLSSLVLWDLKPETFLVLFVISGNLVRFHWKIQYIRVVTPWRRVMAMWPSWLENLSPIASNDREDSVGCRKRRARSRSTALLALLHANMRPLGTKGIQRDTVLHNLQPAA